jgi:hypothetical protein
VESWWGIEEAYVSKGKTHRRYIASFQKEDFEKKVVRNKTSKESLLKRRVF